MIIQFFKNLFKSKQKQDDFEGMAKQYPILTTRPAYTAVWSLHDLIKKFKQRG